MALPIRTTLDDITDVCGYLAKKPTGATAAEAKAVLDKKRLDGRKLSALKFWGLVEEEGDRMKLTELGRSAVKDNAARRSAILMEIVRRIAPYAAIIERTAHRGETTITATEVAAHWHEHFKGDASDNEKILNDQAVCFFQIAEGADLGVLTIGRKGQPTRFDFNLDATSAFVGRASPLLAKPDEELESPDERGPEAEHGESLSTPQKPAVKGNRVFITHGKNLKILDQVKEIVTFGKFEPVVTKEHETTSKPVPDKVMEDMRSCQAAVIHVGSEGILYGKDGNEFPQINGNVLIEIGAAMALYGKNFILLVEEGVELPSNLQGLYECRYTGEELGQSATMKLLKAFNEFK